MKAFNLLLIFKHVLRDGRLILEVKEFLHFSQNFLCRNYLKLLGQKLHIQHKQTSSFNSITPSREWAEEMECSPSFEYLYTQPVLPQYEEHRYSISAASLQKLMGTPKKETISLGYVAVYKGEHMVHCKETILSSSSADSNFFMQITSKNANKIITMDAFPWKY